MFFRDLGFQIVSIAAVLILLGFSKPMYAFTQRNKTLMWIAFVVTAICGLLLGNGLFSVVRWLTGWSGPFPGLIGSIGQLAALALGWYGVYLVVPLVRDLLDGQPDEDARRAALWIPTALPAGYAAWVGLVQDPQGAGTTLKGLIMAAITLGFCIKARKAALAGDKAKLMWKYVAAAFSLVAGLVNAPALAYLFRLATPWIKQAGLPITTLHVRILIGVIGFGYLVAATIDIAKDKEPDKYVRRLLAYGVPCLMLASGATFLFISNGVSGGAGHITGAVS